MIDNPIKWLIKFLNNKGYEVYRQGSLSEGVPYPASFFTYYNTYTEYDAYFDNSATTLEYAVSLYFYSTDISQLYTVFEQMRKELKAYGWLCPDAGADTPSADKEHYGRVVELYFKETR